MGAFAIPLFVKTWWKLAAGMILGAALCFPLAQCDGKRIGKASERAAWEAKAAEMKIRAEQMQRTADNLRLNAEALQRAANARNRQEVDNAVRNIPDQGTSPRQHARACLELRRQGQNPPACQPQPAR